MDLSVICRRLGFDNLNPIIWHKISNASYEVSNGSKFQGKPYEPNAIIELDTEYCRMAASRLMSENTSLFSHADLQIQLRAPATLAPENAIADVLHESSPDYRTRQPKRPTSPARKSKAPLA